MSAELMFVAGLMMSLVSALLVVIYLRAHLKLILIDLCGTPERAGFWTAFTNVTLLLVPAIFALRYRPEVGTFPSLVFELSAQLENALIGLVCTVIVLGIVLNSSIRRYEAAGISARERRTA
jgi:hypothetical protein